MLAADGRFRNRATRASYWGRPLQKLALDRNKYCRNPRSMDVPDVRPLTEVERALTRWMLEQGGDGARPFLGQLDAAHVVSRCGCGCASINFAVAGMPAPTGGLRILADFLYDGPEGTTGAFVFEQNGVLGGVEVYGLEGGAPAVLPEPSELRLI